MIFGHKKPLSRVAQGIFKLGAELGSRSRGTMDPAKAGLRAWARLPMKFKQSRQAATAFLRF